MRAGQLLGLLFLIGPVSDLADASNPRRARWRSRSPWPAFVALYLALLPPARPIARRGVRGVWAALAVLAATAG